MAAMLRQSAEEYFEGESQNFVGMFIPNTVFVRGVVVVCQLKFAPPR